MKTKRTPGLSGKAFTKALEDLGNTVSETGWFSSAKYEDGTPVAYVASIQEYGCDSPPIPKRLGMRATINEKTERWKAIVVNGSKKMLKGQATPDEVMKTVAVEALGDFKRTISKVTTPPLSTVTLLLRKRRKQLDRKIAKESKPEFLGPVRSRRIGGADVGAAFAESRSRGPVGADKHAFDVSGVSTKPLIDTGYLFDTMTTLVRKK